MSVEPSMGLTSNCWPPLWNRDTSLIGTYKQDRLPFLATFVLERTHEKNFFVYASINAFQDIGWHIVACGTICSLGVLQWKTSEALQHMVYTATSQGLGVAVYSSGSWIIQRTCYTILELLPNPKQSFISHEKLKEMELPSRALHRLLAELYIILFERRNLENVLQAKNIRKVQESDQEQGIRSGVELIAICRHGTVLLNQQTVDGLPSDHWGEVCPAVRLVVLNVYIGFLLDLRDMIENGSNPPVLPATGSRYSLSTCYVQFQVVANFREHKTVSLASLQSSLMQNVLCCSCVPVLPWCSIGSGEDQNCE